MHTDISRLNVGCGMRPTGDVNIDYKTGKTFETTTDPKGKTLNPHNFRNFIKADALHLPFKDKAFIESYCGHVIEHVKNPYKLLSELIRVTKNRVMVVCPHRFSSMSKGFWHRQHFNLTWFYNTLKGYDIHTKLSYWYPLKFLGLVRLPHEITITIFLGWKDEKS